MVVLFLYLFDKRKNRANALRMEADNESESRLEEDDKYALSRIGKDSVYSYFVTGWQLGYTCYTGLDPHFFHPKCVKLYRYATITIHLEMPS
jgi:hypothetical protein